MKQVRLEPQQFCVQQVLATSWNGKGKNINININNYNNVYQVSDLNLKRPKKKVSLLVEGDLLFDDISHPNQLKDTGYP